MAVIAGLALWGSPGARRSLGAVLTRSSALDVQLLLGRQLLRAVGWLPATLSGLWLAQQLVFALDRIARPAVDLPEWAVTALYSLALFVAWDASRYVLHRLMHEIPALWAFHQIHHSAEHLTPLTFHRIHPVESLLYQLRGMLVTAVVAALFFWVFRARAVQLEILGVHAVGFVLSALFGNLRHSHVWLRFGPLERWLVSPAQHQIHHALDLDRFNYGTWLAVWDRLGGPLRLAGSDAPERYGIADRNHSDDLISAWLGPFLELSGARRDPLPVPEPPARAQGARGGTGEPGRVR